MEINFDLLDAAIDAAANEANGYKHHQVNWASLVNPYAIDKNECGTGLCLAGFAAMLKGAEVPEPVLGDHCEWEMPGWWVNSGTGRLGDRSAWDSVHVSTFASTALGLTESQADALFSSYNTIDGLREMRDYLLQNPDADAESLRRLARVR